MAEYSVEGDSLEGISSDVGCLYLGCSEDFFHGEPVPCLKKTERQSSQSTTVPSSYDQTPAEFDHTTLFPFTPDLPFPPDISEQQCGSPIVEQNIGPDITGEFGTTHIRENFSEIENSNFWLANRNEQRFFETSNTCFETKSVFLEDSKSSNEGGGEKKGENWNGKDGENWKKGVENKSSLFFDIWRNNKTLSSEDWPNDDLPRGDILAKPFFAAEKVYGFYFDSQNNDSFVFPKTEGKQPDFFDKNDAFFPKRFETQFAPNLEFDVLNISNSTTLSDFKDVSAVWTNDDEEEFRVEFSDKLEHPPQEKQNEDHKKEEQKKKEQNTLLSSHLRAPITDLQKTEKVEKTDKTEKIKNLFEKNQNKLERTENLLNKTKENALHKTEHKLENIAENKLENVTENITEKIHHKSEKINNISEKHDNIYQKVNHKSQKIQTPQNDTKIDKAQPSAKKNQKSTKELKLSPQIKIPPKLELAQDIKGDTACGSDPLPPTESPQQISSGIVVQKMEPPLEKASSMQNKRGESIQKISEKKNAENIQKTCEKIIHKTGENDVRPSEHEMVQASEEEKFRNGGNLPKCDEIFSINTEKCAKISAKEGKQRAPPKAEPKIPSKKQPSPAKKGDKPEKNVEKHEKNEKNVDKVVEKVEKKVRNDKRIDVEKSDKLSEKLSEKLGDKLSDKLEKCLENVDKSTDKSGDGCEQSRAMIMSRISSLALSGLSSSSATGSLNRKDKCDFYDQRSSLNFCFPRSGGGSWTADKDPLNADFPFGERGGGMNIPPLSTNRKLRLSEDFFDSPEEEQRFENSGQSKLLQFGLYPGSSSNSLSFPQFPGNRTTPEQTFNFQNPELGSALSEPNVRFSHPNKTASKIAANKSGPNLDLANPLPQLHISNHHNGGPHNLGPHNLGPHNLGPHNLGPHNAAHNTPHDIPHNIPHNVPHNVLHNMPHNTPHNSPHSTPNNTPHNTLQNYGPQNYGNSNFVGGFGLRRMTEVRTRMPEVSFGENSCGSSCFSLHAKNKVNLLVNKAELEKNVVDSGEEGSETFEDLVPVTLPAVDVCNEKFIPTPPYIDALPILNGGKTTVMLRNIPNKYDQQLLMCEIDIRFKGLYDFFYLPIDFRNKCNVGYAFANLIHPFFAALFHTTFEGSKLTQFRSSKICQVSWGRVQGLRANIQYYRHSAVLAVPDSTCKPMLLRNGVPLPWPQKFDWEIAEDPVLRRVLTKNTENIENDKNTQKIPHEKNENVILHKNKNIVDKNEKLIGEKNEKLIEKNEKIIEKNENNIETNMEKNIEQYIEKIIEKNENIEEKTTEILKTQNIILGDICEKDNWVDGGTVQQEELHMYVDLDGLDSVPDHAFVRMASLGAIQRGIGTTKKCGASTPKTACTTMRDLRSSSVVSEEGRYVPLEHEALCGTNMHLKRKKGKSGVTIEGLKKDQKKLVARYESDITGIIDNPNCGGQSLHPTTTMLDFYRKPNPLRALFASPCVRKQPPCWDNNSLQKIQRPTPKMNQKSLKIDIQSHNRLRTTAKQPYAVERQTRVQPFFGSKKEQMLHKMFPEEKLFLKTDRAPKWIKDHDNSPLRFNNSPNPMLGCTRKDSLIQNNEARQSSKPRSNEVLYSNIGFPRFEDSAPNSARNARHVEKAVRNFEKKGTLFRDEFLEKARKKEHKTNIPQQHSSGSYPENLYQRNSGSDSYSGNKIKNNSPHNTSSDHNNPELMGYFLKASNNHRNNDNQFLNTNSYQKIYENNWKTAKENTRPLFLTNTNTWNNNNFQNAQNSEINNFSRDFSFPHFPYIDVVPREINNNPREMNNNLRENTRQINNNLQRENNPRQNYNTHEHCADHFDHRQNFQARENYQFRDNFDPRENYDRRANYDENYESRGDPRGIYESRGIYEPRENFHVNYRENFQPRQNFDPREIPHDFGADFLQTFSEEQQDTPKIGRPLNGANNNLAPDNNSAPEKKSEQIYPGFSWPRTGFPSDLQNMDISRGKNNNPRENNNVRDFIDSLSRGRANTREKDEMGIFGEDSAHINPAPFFDDDNGPTAPPHF